MRAVPDLYCVRYGGDRMKREWSVIRAILEQVEHGTFRDYIKEGGFKELSLDAGTCTREILLGHLEILADAGVLKNCRIFRDGDGRIEQWDLIGIYITMQGHDLLDAMRSDTVWNAIKRRAERAGTAISWEMIKVAIPVVLKELIK